MIAHDFMVVHYAEIGIKGKNRSMFENRLVDNIRKALEGLEHKSVKRVTGRVLVELSKGSDEKKIARRLERVFGISGFSPCWSCKSSMKDIEGKALEVMKGKKGSFRVSATRSWKQFKTNSNKVNEKVGAAIVKKYGLKVNLTKPKTNLFMEILNDRTLLYTERLSGPGGLPVGVSGKVVCLLSGGIDSPVAGILMMKRGCEVEFVHFQNEVAGGIGKMKQMMATLEQYQPNARVHVVPFRTLQNEVIAKVKADYRMLVYRRFMLRIAERLTGKLKAKALVTGNALGQVASQTTENIAAIEVAVSMPVFSPLIGFDKQEIIELAKRYGTYDISIKPYEDCCTFMIAAHPQTRARVKDVDRMERGLDINGMVEKALAGATVFKHSK
ncbi:MAG: tRNA uracil 4-sulfurtransferase ThiI [Candidatus Aenigmarchaeota archaeon]